MQIITLAHQKGGVGKSTLALLLAGYFRQGGLSVGLVDTDPQGSLTYAAGGGLGNLSLVELPADAAQLRQAPYELLVVDTPPYLSSQLPALFRVSDLVLIPSRAGYFDALAIRDTAALVRVAQADVPSLRAAIVLNLIKSRTALTDDVRSLIESLDIPILQTTLADRVAYTRAPLSGGIVTVETDARAAAEIESLAIEVTALLIEAH
jgi:chromosome partitioning protein